MLFPKAQGAPNTFLTNDGLGGLSWTTPNLSGLLLSTNNLSEITDKATSRSNLGLGSLSTMSIVSSAEISDLSIVNDDIATAAAIDGIKINPVFGAQNLSVGAGNELTINASGNFSMINGVPTSFPATQGANGHVLTNDGSGNLTWATAGAFSGWGLNGNSGTSSASNFIGTTDAQDFIIKANNTELMKFTASGQIGISTTPISAKMDVLGDNTSMAFHAGTSFASGVSNRALDAYAAGGNGNFGLYSVAEINGSYGAVGVWGEALGNGSGDATGVWGNMNSSFTITSGTTYAIRGDADGGATNWAGYFGNGHVHIRNGLSVGSTDGNFGTTGQVLTSNGTGSAPSWSDLFAWSTNGNSTTGIEFIGTLNDQPLVFKQNGFQAGIIDNSTNQNTFFGYQSGINNTSTSNTGVGYMALSTNNTGTNNTAFGAGANVTTGNLTNATAIGANTIVSASNSMRFGDGNVLSWGFAADPQGGEAIRVGNTISNGNGATLTSAGVWTSASDSTKKYHITTLQYGLSEVMKLKPVSYQWKGNGQKDFGFLAQELKTILPEIVYGTEGQMSISYGQITSVLTKAVQELAKQNEDQSIRINQLESLVAEKEKQILNLETKAAEQQTTAEQVKKLAMELEKIKETLGMQAKKD